MMSAETANMMYARILRETGQDLVLRRTGVADLPLKGCMSEQAIDKNLAPEVASGKLIQTSYDVIVGSSEITAASWPLPIRKGDKLLSGSKVYTVEKAEDVTIGNQIVRFNLVVKG